MTLIEKIIITIEVRPCRPRITELHVCVPCNPSPRQNSRRGRRQFPSDFPSPAINRYFVLSVYPPPQPCIQVSNFNVQCNRINRVGSNSWQHFIAAAANNKKKINKIKPPRGTIIVK